MKLFNPDLFVNIIFPYLVYNTLISGVVAMIAGTVIGLLVKVIRRQSWAWVVLAIVGAFLGGLLSLFPLYVVPGIVGGGPYSGIYILPVLFFVLPIGATVGAFLLPSTLMKRSKDEQKKVILRVVIGIYLFMAITMFISYSVTCSRPNSLADTCVQAGYPPRRR